MTSDRFSFAFDPAYRIAGRAFGVTPSSAHVVLDEDLLVATFGPWRVETPRRNIEGAGVTGPYRMLKTIGSAHLSLADRGLTFATNGRAGACLTFREPVRGIDPLGLIRHPGLTVTVDDPDRLVARLTDGPVRRTDRAEREAEQQAVDDLHTMSARELRALADELGISHTSSTKKATLVQRIEAATDEQVLVEVLDDSA